MVVIDLREPAEFNAEQEAAATRQLGLHYCNIPVSTAEPRNGQADKFLKLTAAAQYRPAFIHCASANAWVRFGRPVASCWMAGRSKTPKPKRPRSGRTA